MWRNCCRRTAQNWMLWPGCSCSSSHSDWHYRSSSDRSARPAILLSAGAAGSAAAVPADCTGQLRLLLLLHPHRLRPHRHPCRHRRYWVHCWPTRCWNGIADGIAAAVAAADASVAAGVAVAAAAVTDCRGCKKIRREAS